MKVSVDTATCVKAHPPVLGHGVYLPHNALDNQISKDVRKVRDYEQQLVSNYRHYLTLLDDTLRGSRTKKAPLYRAVCYIEVVWCSSGVAREACQYREEEKGRQ